MSTVYKGMTDAKRAANRRWYQRNKPYWYARNNRKRKCITDWFEEYKTFHPCTDCSLYYPSCVMDFDHRPGEVKLYEPNGLKNTMNWRKVFAELAKCDLVCSNCHRIRTHARRGAKSMQTLNSLPAQFN
jgi:hypothetical protein